MRNLVEFPVTPEEVIDVLATMRRIDPYDLGVNNMIRHHIIEFFLKPENMEQLLKEMRV